MAAITLYFLLLVTVRVSFESIMLLGRIEEHARKIAQSVSLPSPAISPRRAAATPTPSGITPYGSSSQQEEGSSEEEAYRVTIKYGDVVVITNHELRLEPPSDSEAPPESMPLQNIRQARTAGRTPGISPSVVVALFNNDDELVLECQDRRQADSLASIINQAVEEFDR